MKTLARLIAVVLFSLTLHVPALAEDVLDCATDAPGVATLTFTPDRELDEIEIRLHGSLLETLADGPYLPGEAVVYETPALTVPQRAVFEVGAAGDPQICVIILEADPVAEVELLPDFDLDPDEGPYIGFMVFDVETAIGDVQFDVEIDHPDLRFLEVALSSWSGTTVAVHGGTPGSDLDLTYWELGLPNFDGSLSDCGCAVFPTGPGRLADFAGENLVDPGTGTGVWSVLATSDLLEGTVDRVAMRAYEVGPAFAVANVDCERSDDPQSVDLSWTNLAAYDEIEVYVEGVLDATLRGPFAVGVVESYTTLPRAVPDTLGILVRGVIEGAPGPFAFCEADILVRPVTSVGCVSRDGSFVDLSWENNDAYDVINVYLDGVLETTVDGGATSVALEVDFDAPATLQIDLEGSIRAVGESAPTGCEALALDDADIEACAGLVEVTSAAAVGVLVDDHLAIEEVEAVLDLRTMFVTSWNISLRSPYGTEVQLHDFLSGFDGSFFLLYDDDGIANDVPYACGCAMEPRGPGALADFEEESSEGEWVFDLVTVLAGGVLQAACVRIDGCDLPAPSAFECAVTDDTVALSWVNEVDYDAIDIFEGDVLIATLDGSDESTEIGGLLTGRYHYWVVGVSDDPGCRASTRDCRADVGLVESCVTDVLVDASDFETAQTVSDSFELLEVETRILYNTILLPEILELESPAGTVVGLHDLPLLANGMDLVYDDDGIPSAFPFNCGTCPMQPSGPGTLDDFQDELSDGEWTLRVETGLAGGVLEEWCLLLASAELSGDPGFLRGDADGNGLVFCLLDVSYLLDWAFSGGPVPPCLDAADLDDNGDVFPLLDALVCLEWAFSGGDPPALPGPFDCGPDPDGADDGLDCDTPSDGCP